MSRPTTDTQAMEQALQAIEGLFAGGVKVWAVGGSFAPSNAATALRLRLGLPVERVASQPAVPQGVALVPVEPSLRDTLTLALEYIRHSDPRGRFRLYGDVEKALSALLATPSQAVAQPPADGDGATGERGKS